MFDHFADINRAFLDRLPKYEITIKRDPTSVPAPGTGHQVISYGEEIKLRTYVTDWSLQQIEHSAGKLTMSSLKVILEDEVLPSDVIEIEDKDHKVVMIGRRAGYYVVGVNPL